MRSPLLRISILALAAVSSFGVSHANWTASGTFQYIDREYGETGFTGLETPQPIRVADVEVVDANQPAKKAVIATGVTDALGGFSIFVNDSKVRDVFVRVISRSSETGDLNIDVRVSSTGKATYYAAATNTVAGHDPSTSVDFGTAIVQVGQGGEAFNIYDQMLLGMDYLASLEGSRPGQTLSTAWASDGGIGGSQYCVSCVQVILRDTAGYDDTVILHEIGHFAIFEFSASHSPTGSHGFFQCGQDIRLAFDEGFATYWGNSALRHHGIAGSNLYVRTTGGAGAGNLVRLGDLETDTQFFCQGATNELNNFSMLWDIVDGPSTTDTSPGVDDSHDLLDLDDIEVWEVMINYIPGAANISLEDFWDGWFLAPALNGFRSEMIAIGDHLAIEYHEDPLEVNDSTGQATPVLANGSGTHSTFFRDPELNGAGAADDDYFSFSASGDQSYVVDTRNLRSDGNTFLEILDTNGVTVLASNDDRAAGDESSRVDWTAPRSDLFFVHVNHAADLGIYGSYDLVVAAQTPVDNDGDGFDTSTDCNDDDPAINPLAVEACDGIDQDCDGVIDNGFDVDNDGFTTCGGDCDDSNPNVNPGVAEVPGNGIDDNCDGQIDEQPATDIVTITLATYKIKPKKLLVEATSDQQPDVILTVVGFEEMDFDPDRNVYTFLKRTTNPGTVTVESSGGGSDTQAVTSEPGEPLEPE